MQTDGGWLFMPSYEQISNLLPVSLRDEYIRDVRYQGGDRVLITMGGKTPVVFEPMRSRTISAPGRWSYVSTNGAFLVWFDDAKEAVTFVDGTVISVSATERFGVSQNSEYCYTYSPGKGTCVYRTRAPQQQAICVFDNAVPYRLIADELKVYLCAVKVGSLNGRKSYDDICTQIDVATNDVHVNRVLSLPGAVVDIAPGGCWFLLDNRSDILPQWFIYDERSAARHCVGTRREYGFWVDIKLVRKLRALKNWVE